MSCGSGVTPPHLSGSRRLEAFFPRGKGEVTADGELPEGLTVPVETLEALEVGPLGAQERLTLNGLALREGPISRKM